ncbi:MAG: hypothetical protein GX796_02705, partial [Clostridiaceae bacterium]|nr:hypothetical protein [Clostridiaceae bacterium]
GVERSIKAISEADFVVILTDISQGFLPEDEVLLNKVLVRQKPHALCFNKTDLIKDNKADEFIKAYPNAILMSISEDIGIEKLEEHIFGIATENRQDIDNQVLITNARDDKQLKTA